MKKKNFFILIVLITIIVGYFTAPYAKLYFQRLEKTINQQEVNFYVPTGTTFDELEKHLIEDGIIDEKSKFREMAEFKNLNDNNIGAGKYRIKKKHRVSHLINGFKLNALGNGNGELEVSVTFNNCRDLNDVAGKVEKFIEADSATLIAAFQSNDVLKLYGFNSKTFPAMFIPNTYNMFWDTSVEQFIGRMADEFKRFWTPERKEKASELNLTESNISTLASIVYAEQSRAKDEWKTIAGLYINRLKKGIRLQSDPTFKFCWGRSLDHTQRLYNKHREIDCPYNTYIYSGLPPGPINIPPSAVLDAVLNYEKHNYIFMCAQANNSGTHVFAKTNAEHEKNAAAFRAWMNERGIR